MMLAAALSAAIASPTLHSSLLFWEQHEPEAIYTSAGLSLRPGSKPAFSTATWANDPEFVGVFDTATPDGSNDWTFAAPAGNEKQVPAWQVAQARHAVAAVDTFAALGTWFAPYECRVFAWASAGNGTPAWTFTAPNCSSGAAAISMEDDAVAAVSDNGSAAAFSGYAAGTPTVFVFDLQTGRLRFNATCAAAEGGGPVTLSPSGAWVAWSASNVLQVYDGATGAARGAPVKIGGGRCVVSDSGLVVTRGEVLSWSAAAGAYVVARALELPPVSCAGRPRF